MVTEDMWAGRSKMLAMACNHLDLHRAGLLWFVTTLVCVVQVVTEEMWAGRSKRFPEETPSTKEYYLLRSIFEEHFPSKSALDTVPKVIKAFFLCSNSHISTANRHVLQQLDSRTLSAKSFGKSSALQLVQEHCSDLALAGNYFTCKANVALLLQCYDGCSRRQIMLK